MMRLDLEDTKIHGENRAWCYYSRNIGKRDLMFQQDKFFVMTWHIN